MNGKKLHTLFPFFKDGYRVFTFDHERFPNPKKLVQDLLEMGIRVVPIVDPGVKEDPEYKTYQEGTYEDHFCKYIEGPPYFGDVWPGKSAFPDFTNTKTREWWGQNHKFYSDMGIHGIWNDMNEPAVFNETKTMDVKVLHGNNGHPKTHRELHNVYGLLMGESTYNGMKKLIGGDRPFLLTRAGYASGTTHRAVYLPHGTWHDYWTDTVYEGGQHVLIKAELDVLPIFVKAGSILPHGTVKPNSAVKETKMTFHVYAELDGSTEYSLYEDDAKTFAYEDDHFAEININCSFSKNLIKIELNQESSGYTPDWTEYEVVIHHPAPDTEIKLNGQTVKGNRLNVNDTVIFKGTLQHD